MSKAPSAGPARSTTAPSTSTSTAEQVSRTEGTLDASLQQTTEDFPDPDDSALDEELAKELEEQMQGFLKGLDGAEADTLAKLMQDFLPPADRTNVRPRLGDCHLVANADLQDAPSNASGPSTSSAQPKDFKSSVASTLEKMRQSERSADQSSSTGDDPAAMLSSLLGGLGDLPDGDEASLQAMLDQMMSQLMSKDLLYEPLKEMRDKVGNRSRFLPEHFAETCRTVPSLFGRTQDEFVQRRV